MNIIGLNAAVLGVEDVDASKRYCADFGLTTVERASGGVTAEALDGTHLVVRAASDTSLPASIAPPPNLRETVWGVSRQIRHRCDRRRADAKTGRSNRTPTAYCTPTTTAATRSHSSSPAATPTTPSRSSSMCPASRRSARRITSRSIRTHRSSRALSRTSSISCRIWRRPSDSMPNVSASSSPTALGVAVRSCALPAQRSITIFF